MRGPQDSQNSQPEMEEVVSFDDCLRILVNTPPQPKKTEKAEESQTAAEQQEKV